MKKLLICCILLAGAAPVFAVQDTDFTMSDAVLKEKKADCEVWIRQDGVIITVYADRSEALFPDKSKIVKYKDGRREVFAPDGSKSVIVDEAKGERTYAGASKQTISFGSRTPFGEPIERVEKKVLKSPALVRMIYIPEKSDELLYPAKTEEKVDMEISSFFDTLYDSLRQKYINDANEKKDLPSKPFDILVSYCRYCKTGYCFGKERKVVVEIAEGDKVVKTFAFDGLQLREKGLMKGFVKQVIESVSQ